LNGSAGCKALPFLVSVVPFKDLRVQRVESHEAMEDDLGLYDSESNVVLEDTKLSEYNSKDAYDAIKMWECVDIGDQHSAFALRVEIESIIKSRFSLRVEVFSINTFSFSFWFFHLRKFFSFMVMKMKKPLDTCTRIESICKQLNGNCIIFSMCCSCGIFRKIY